MTKTRIMLVEDEAITAMDISTSLEELGYDVPAIASNGEEALILANKVRPDLILMDITLVGDMDGIETAKKIRLAQKIPIIFLTAHLDSETVAKAKTAEPFGYLTKPCGVDSLMNTIEVALYKSEADARVRESEERFRKLLENVPSVAVQGYALDGTVLFWNRASELLYGYSAAEALGGNFIDLIVPPKMREGVVTAIRQIGETGKPILAGELIMMRKDGSHVPVYSSHSLVHPYGRQPELFCIDIDLTDRKQAEAEILRLNNRLEHLVEERTAALVMTNRDLSSFCYAISHELRAPVARLQGFSKILTEELIENPAEARLFAERIAVASEQLQRVIDAVLLLARMGQSPFAPQPINLSDLAREIATELVNSASGRQIELAIAEGLTASGDPQMLKICLENLLGNALNFSVWQPVAKIEFGRDAVSGGFFVRDNGIGFDMARAEKLFEPFQRLHRQEDFPGSGSGIGLATVQRIIERHNGKIWAESTPGQGATFYFTLGAVQEGKK